MSRILHLGEDGKRSTCVVRMEITPDPGPWDDVINEAGRVLRECGKLEAGWDTYDGRPMHEDALEVAGEILDELLLAMADHRTVAQVLVGPRSDGLVEVEITKADRELSLSWSPGDVLEVYVSERWGELDAMEREFVRPSTYEHHDLIAWVLTGEGDPR